MRKRMKKPAALALVLAIAVLFAAPLQAADRSDDIAALQKQLQQIKDQLSSLEGTVEDAQTKKEALQKQSDVLSQQITLMLSDIETAKQAVADKQKEVDDSKQQIAQTDALFRERLRAMQVMHTSGAVSTLLGANSFDELLTAGTTLSRISISDTELLERLAQQKAQLETEEQALADQLQTLNDQQAALQQKQQELATSIHTQDDKISEAQAEKESKQSEYDQTYASYRAAVDETNAWMATHYSTGTTYTGGALSYPLLSSEGYFYLSSGYGYRSDPFGGGNQEFHNGYDFAGGNGALLGRPVHAAANGTVIKVEYRSTGYGLKVIIDHGGGLTTLYGHLSAIYVAEGQQVTRGEVIAAAGNSGNSTAAHLHFSVFQNGAAQDPGGYLG